MNETRWRELQQIRGEQNALADRLAQLERRLRSLETGAEAETLEPPVATVPVPSPVPVAPPSVPPPLPPEAFAFRSPPPPPEMPPPLTAQAAAPVPPKESLEVRIGTTWLVRVGVVALLTGLVFVGSYLYNNIVPQLGPVAKVGLMYLGAGALAGAGAWLERGKEAARSATMLNFARVVLAGGLASVYYVTYAAHWNPNLLVLRGALLDGALLIAWTAFMVWLADRRSSEVLATFAVLLAYYASAVNEIAVFTLFSNLTLTVAAVYLLRRHLWRVFPYASLLATFGSYGFWRYYHAVQGGTGSPQSTETPDRFWIEATFLLIYWLLFTGSVFVPGAAHWTPRRRAGFATLNNGAFFVLTTWILHGQYPGAFRLWSLGFGVVLCVLAETARRVRPRVDRETEGAYFLQGVVLVTLGFFAFFDGWQLGLVLAAQSVVLHGRAQWREERLPLWLSLASAFAAFAVAAGRLADWQSPFPWPSAVGAGALLVSNAWWSQDRLNKPAPSPSPAPGDLPDFRATLAAAPACFSGLGLALWFLVVERTLAGNVALVPALAAAAAAATASAYVLRVRIVPFYAQAFLLGAYVHRFSDDDLAGLSHAGTPAWSMAALFVVTLALGHWWQRGWPWTGERLRPPPRASDFFAGFDAVLAVLLLYDWLRPGAVGQPTVPGWVAENAVVSLALLAYGLWTRYRSLAVAGQGLLLASIAGCVLRVWAVHRPVAYGSEMSLTLVPLAVLLATIFAGRQHPAKASLGLWPAVYEGVATLFFLAWVLRYVPAEASFTVFGVVGAGVSALALVRREPRWLWWSGAAGIAGVASLALLERGGRASFLHLVGVAAIAGQQQFARYRIKRSPDAASAAPPQWQAASIVTATLCAWVVLTARMTLSFEGAFTLAAAWSFFAALVFVAGLTRQEKVYRWLGLTILVCTLGRIALFDIWQLDSLGRAVSAICLGAVLLGVGYLYNRFHAKWHGLF